MIPTKIQRRGQAPKSMEWEDQNKLIEVMEENKLLDIILGENAHAEILRKVEEIFEFYVTRQKLKKEHIETLWKSSNEKHEEETRACLDLLSNLVKKMDINLIRELFHLIEMTKFENEIQINFLMRYTINVIELTEFEPRRITSRTKSDIAETKLYDLNKFWKLILDRKSVV